MRTIEVTYADSSTDLVAFRKKCIIASGSSPVRMKIVGVPAERLITNEEFFYLSELPKSITIIGGGPIGAELATACARFGVETYLLSREYLSREPREVASRSLTALQKSGVQYVAARADRLADKKLFLEDGTTIPETEYYLVAVGRRPNTELNLEAASIEYSEKGIAIDTNLLTTNRNIFAIGDCTESPQFTHLAAHHAKFVLKKLLVPFVKKRIRALPRVTFTAPPIASVGELTETKHHKQFVLNFTKLDRAVLSADTKSYRVVLVDLRTGKIKGASLYGAFSENLITVFTLIIDAEIALLQLSDFITPYPTYGNIFHALTVEYLRYISKNWKRYPLGSLYQMVRYVLG